MKSIRLFFGIIAVAGVLVLNAGGASAAGIGQQKSLHDIPLAWMPTDSISSTEGINLEAYGSTRFLVRPFTDAREDKTAIGKNVEKNAPRYVTTQDNVASWVTDKFAEVLKATGLRVVGSNETVVLEGEIVKFFVTEKDRYNADVTLKLRLKSKNNEVLWEGMTSGNDNRWGLSYKEANYFESLSNALNTAVHAIFKNQDFERAAQKAK